MSSECSEFALVAYDGTPRSTGPMTITVDAAEIRWTSPKTSGRVGYHEIASIALNLGDPDGHERDDQCIISTEAGLCLKIYCEADRSAAGAKLWPVRRRAYSDFVLLLHQRLTAEDRQRIAFQTDGKLTEKAQRFLVGGWLVSSIALIAIGHPAALGVGWAIVQAAAASAL